MNLLPPRVSRSSHYFVNGAIWLAAGLHLLFLAIEWYSESDNRASFIGGFLTFSSGILLSQTRFKIIAGKFTTHINHLPDKSWFFSFQAPKHYTLLLFMIFLGLFLRHYSGLSSYILALIYTIVGTTLSFSSYYFFRYLLNSNVDKDQKEHMI